MAEPGLKAALLPRIGALLWRGIVLLVVLLAVYVSFGRYLTSLISTYQDEILAQVNARLDFRLEVDRLQGHWHSFQPSFELRGFRLRTDADESAPLEIAAIDIGLDVFASLRSFSPQLFALTATGVNLHVVVAEDGSLLIPGLPASGGMSGSRLFDFVFNTQRVSLAEVAVHMHSHQYRQQRTVHLP